MEGVLSSLARHIQHYDAPSLVIQYGLSLGMHSTKVPEYSRRCALFISPCPHNHYAQYSALFPSSAVRKQSIPLNVKQRCAIPHNLDSYNPLNYFAYVVYPPLYIAGPIMTFNDFYWQVNRPWFLRVYLELILGCSIAAETCSHRA